MGVPIVREVDMNLIWYCFMGMTAVADLIKRMIPGWMFWGFGVIGAAGRIMEMVWGSSGDMAGGPDAARRLVGIGCSVAVGGALLVVSRLLHGDVGEGDGLFFVVSGLYVPWKINLGLLCYGLMFCCGYGMMLIIWGVVRGVPVRKMCIPFLPFVSIAAIFMNISHMWQL